MSKRVTHGVGEGHWSMSKMKERRRRDPIGWEELGAKCSPYILQSAQVTWSFISQQDPLGVLSKALSCWFIIWNQVVPISPKIVKLPLIKAHLGTSTVSKSGYCRRSWVRILWCSREFNGLCTESTKQNQMWSVYRSHLVYRQTVAVPLVLPKFDNLSHLLVFPVTQYVDLRYWENSAIHLIPLAIIPLLFYPYPLLDPKADTERDSPWLGSGTFHNLQDSSTFKQETLVKENGQVGRDREVQE